MVTMDWLGTALNLPKEFLFSGPGNGGGVIQVKKLSIMHYYIIILL